MQCCQNGYMAHFHITGLKSVTAVPVNWGLSITAVTAALSQLLGEQQRPRITWDASALICGQHLCTKWKCWVELDRMNFPMYFQAFQKVQSFVAWTLVKTIFCVFKYWSETSFSQQSIHSSSIIICNRPVFPLHYLYNDSAHNCYSRVSTQDTLVLMLYSAHTAQYDSFARLLVVFVQCYFRAQAKP